MSVAMVRTIMKNLPGFALIALVLFWGIVHEWTALSNSLQAAGPGTALRSSREIQWTESLEDAIQASKISNKPILIHFYGDNCPPCRMLEKKAFKDHGLIEAMHVHVIPVRINAEKDRTTADRYKVNRWPTDVYLFPNGDEIYRGTSNQDPTVFEKTLERVALRNRDWNLEQRSIAEVRERRQDRRLADMSRSARSGIPSDGTAPAAHDVVAKSAQWTSDAKGSSTTVKVSLTGASDPINTSQSTTPSQQPTTATQQLGNRAVSNPHASQPVPPSTAVAPTTSIPATTTIAPAAVPRVTSGLSNAPHSAAPGTEPTSGQIALLTSAPGLNGYCPVALQNAIRNPNAPGATSPWVRGNPQFAVRHRGRIYHCETEQARTALLANPDRYAPALSGCDLVEFAKTGDWVDGNCEFGFIEQRTGRVFLFSSRANCEEFARNCEAYSQMVGTPAERVASDAAGTVQR
jgi:thiol-disulfide isomerase/thioredoxin